MSFQQASHSSHISFSSVDTSNRKKASSARSDQEEFHSAFDYIKDVSQSKSSKKPPSRDAKPSRSKSHSKASHSKPRGDLSPPAFTQKSSSSKRQHVSTSGAKKEPSQKRKGAPSDTLITYLQDSTHTNPGFSNTYTQGLIYTYGFPEEPAARQDLESEIVNEAQTRVQRSMGQYVRDVESE